MATNRIVSLARKAALLSDHQWKVGAVIYRGSTVLGVGTNDMHKTSPKTPHPFGSRHAEFNAIIAVPFSLRKGASIYVHRIGRDGETHMSKPCKHCAKMLADAELKRIEWSVDAVLS